MALTQLCFSFLNGYFQLFLQILLTFIYAPNEGRLCNLICSTLIKALENCYWSFFKLLETNYLSQIALCCVPWQIRFSYILSALWLEMAVAGNGSMRDGRE